MLTFTSALGLILVFLAIFSSTGTLVNLPVLQQGETGGLSFGFAEVPINAMYLVLVGFCTSIMWGGIFNLAVEGLGKYLAAASGLFHDGGALRVNRAAWTRNRRDLRAEFQETVFDSRHGLFRDPVADRHRRAGLHDRISRLISGNFRKIRAIQLDFYMICDSLLRKQTNHADRAEHCHSPGRTSDRGRNE